MGWALSSDSRDLLREAMLSRAATPDELRTVSALPPDRFDAALAELDEAGLVGLDDGWIEHRAPAETLRARASEVAAQMRTLLGVIEGAVEDLPRVTQDWNLGLHSGGSVFPVETITRPNLLQQFWERSGIEWRGVTEPIRIAATRLDVVSEMEPPDPGHAQEYVTDHQMDVRCLISLAATESAGDAAGFIPPAIDLRIIGHLPSSFMVHADTLLLPVDWASGSLEAALVVTSSPFAAMAAQLFDNYWTQAQPLADEPRGWDPILRLLATGATVESAARALRMPERSARRRVAAAMEHYGVTGLFALGRAWRDSHVGEGLVPGAAGA